MKYKNLTILFLLIIIWSLFFAIYKYYIWGIFKTDTITLQYISGYLSIGTIGAFIIGGLLYELFQEKKYHFATIFLTGILIVSIYFLKNTFIDSLFIAGITLLIGFFYGLWGVLRNILISTQIHETNLGDTKINGLANIFFITSIIIGSITGGMIAEKTGDIGIFLITGLLIMGLIIGNMLRIKENNQISHIKQKAIEYKQNYLKDFSFIVKKYFIIMVFVSLIITIATILSQKAIEYAVEFLGKSGSSAASLLLFSAVGSIVGNIISMKIGKKRWHFFLLFSILFAITINLFPTFIKNFTHTSVLAFIAGIFFGITYNLLESHFFKHIALDNKKSYGAASLGIITSIVIAGLMFFVDFLENFVGFSGVYYFMGSIIFLIGIIIFLKKDQMSH